MPVLDDRDRVVVRRAGRRAAGLAAALVVVVFLLCGALVFLVVATGQDQDARAQLDSAAAHADDVGDPPADISLLLRHPDGRVEVSDGAPPVLPDRPDLDAVLAPGAPPVRVRDVSSAAGDFRILTQRRSAPGGSMVAQAALGLGPLEQERDRLLGGLAAAGAIAVAAALGLGALAGRQAASGLVGALRRQRQFVADASHELRTPLTVLSTRAQLLARHLAAAPLDERTRQVLDDDVARLLADSSGLADVVADLLAASEPEVEPGGCTDLREAVAEAVAGLQPLGGERGVAIELAPPAAGSSADRAPVEVAIAGPALRRCLVALVDNGVRHSAAGGAVTVGWDARGGSGVVRVSDTGPGIPAEVRERLFDRFARGDGTGADGRRRYGLGLALVADTVHRFGGEVDVETGPGGTAFVLTLPRCAGHGAAGGRTRTGALRTL